ncbi:MAG TPA: hypothetical protein VK171_04630 [Fimbriimonas sp.]|nr:hypothetical protein [Fimbriimonas sp.]
MVNNLYGADEIDTSNHWLEKYFTSDEAPILRLCEAILGQAVHDNASEIRIALGHSRPEGQGPPTLETYHQTIEREERIREGKDEFAQVMAEAGVKHYVPPPTKNCLNVDYRFSYLWRAAVEIPLNLADPTLRAMKYKFNFNRCSSLEKPNGLIYRQGYFFTMREWSLEQTLITMEPDNDA